MGLIPTELHYYSLRDLLRGIASARRPAPGKPAAIALAGVGEGTSIRSARAAVIVTLKALGLPAGARIGVPLYCCPVVFKAIKAAGCLPKFIDIDPGTYCLSTADLMAKQAGLDAVIAVHMFGNLCDMPEILAIMAGRPVIEDCAQSLGSRLDGRACGSFGDTAFFSFRSGKYLAVGEGAAVFSRDRDLHARFSALIEALPAPTAAEELKHVSTTYLRSKLRGRFWWGLLGWRIWALYNKKTEFADKSPIVVSRMFGSDVATLHDRLPRLDSMIAAQRAHAAYFDRNLRLAPARLPLEGPRTVCNRFMYPVIFPSTGERDAMAAHLRRNGIGTASPYGDTVEGASRHYGYENDCPSAERTLRTTLVLPSSYALRPRDIERIVRCANEGWAAIRPSGPAQPMTSLRA